MNRSARRAIEARMRQHGRICCGETPALDTRHAWPIWSCMKCGNREKATDEELKLVGIKVSMRDRGDTDGVGRGRDNV